MGKSPDFFLNFSGYGAMSSNNQYSYKFKEFRLDVAERILLRENSPVALAPKAFDVLAVLVGQSGHLVEKDELLRIVWEDAFVEESNVARVVHSLRKILGENEENKFIETVSKKGYRFIAGVEIINGAATSGQNGVSAESYIPSREDCVNYVLQTGDDLVRVEMPSDDGQKPLIVDVVLPEKSVTEKAAAEYSNRRNLKFWILGAVLTFTLSIIGIWYYDDVWTANDKKNENKSIAVLPLKPINNQSRDSIYELGIAESLILKLSSGKGLTVRPLSATRKYLELEQNPTAAGREQQVDFVLSSNYQIAGGKIRVTSQLINTQTGNVEEVFKSEQDSANLFSMQDAIAEEIGDTLLVRFGNRENKLTAKRGTSNEEAYRLYLQAAFIFDQWNKSEIGKAIEYLERAVKLDPEYAAAHTMLAYAYRYFSHKDVAPREQSLKSKAAIERALALDPASADARAVLGLLKFSYEKDSAGAEREFRQAVELDPSSPMPRALYAYFLMGHGRFDEAVSENKKAMEIDPASYAHQITYGMILYYAHRYREAEAHYKKLLAKDPNFVYAYFWMWLLCDLRGSETEAFEWFMRYQTQIKAAPETVRAFQTAYRKSGWKGILREIIAQDEKSLLTHDYAGFYYEIACFSARLGDREKALEFLEKAHKASSSSILFIKVDPYLDALHGDPRFEQIVSRTGIN